MKRIYGIDLAKNKFDVNYLNKSDCEEHLVVPNTFKGICKFLGEITSETLLVAEHTGVYGDLLVFLSNQMDIPICLCSGYRIKHSLGLTKGKSDKYDAQRIREYGERFRDKLEMTKFSSEYICEINELYSLRNQLVKERKMLLTHASKKTQSVLNSISANTITIKMTSSFDESIAALELQIKEVICSRNELKRNYDLITSVKSIGPITACDLIVKTGNFKKLDTARKASSYAGVCPFPNSSGTMVRKSKVSPMSDKSLKTLLFMCARSAIKYNKDLKHYYEMKKLQGKHHYLIMNNVANKLLRTVFSVIESGNPWDPNYICIDPREKP